MTLNLFTRLACAALLAVPAAAYADSADTPPRPDRNPARQAAPKRNPARVEAPEAVHPVLPGDAPTVAWTDAEVAAAKADCVKKLAGVALDYEPLPPLKEGRCGAPAPIRVTSIGSDPKVVIDPPATVTCSVAAGVSTWLDKTVQPKARALMGAPVVKLHNATSYACRNRYGGETTPLSEHALANALDISEFVLQSGKKITVLADWPHAATGSVPAASKPDPSTAPVAVPPVPPRKPGRAAEAPEPPAQFDVSSTTSMGVTAISTISIVNAIKVKANERPMAPAEAKPPAPDPAPAQPEAQSAFVTTAHDEACKVFGTVLGPEANEAHKNHFHFDMKKRRRSAFCE